MNPFRCGPANTNFDGSCPKCWCSPMRMVLTTNKFDREVLECLCHNCGYETIQKPADYNPREKFKKIENKYEYPEDRVIAKHREKTKPKKKNNNPFWLGAWDE